MACVQPSSQASEQGQLAEDSRSLANDLWLKSHVVLSLKQSQVDTWLQETPFLEGALSQWALPPNHPQNQLSTLEPNVYSERLMNNTV